MIKSMGKNENWRERNNKSVVPSRKESIEDVYVVFTLSGLRTHLLVNTALLTLTGRIIVGLRLHCVETNASMDFTIELSK